MPVWKAVILGLVQGLAEFLPVSSSGHLIIIKQVLGVDLGSGGMFFDIMLHFGTLVAIFIAFRKDIAKLVAEGIHIIIDIFANIGIFFARLFRSSKEYRHIIKSSYRKFVMLVIVSTIPTGIIGILLSDIIGAANDMIMVPGVCLFITAAFLVIADLADEGIKKPKEASYVDAGIIGIAQGLSTMPGISRSGTTITACILCGFDKKFAVKYSFIMSIPAVLGAVVLELKDLQPGIIVKDDITGCIIATVVAAVAGYFSICFMMALVRGKRYKYFAIYCIIAGSIAVGYNFWG